MNELFEKCMPVIFSHEGGYVNHPDDPGGETNFGICKLYFPSEDIKNLTKERAKELYYHRYWIPMNLFGIENDLAVLHLFDMGVNAGRHRAIKIAQQLVGAKDDGMCGPKTRQAINGYKNFVPHYATARRDYYNHLAERKPELSVFLKGWLNRVDSTKF